MFERQLHTVVFLSLIKKKKKEVLSEIKRASFSGKTINCLKRNNNPVYLCANNTKVQVIQREKHNYREKKVIAREFDNSFLVFNKK